MKKLFLSFSILLVCLMSLFAFSGCDKMAEVGEQYIMVSLGRFSSGQTIQKFDFSFGTDKLSEIGLTEEEIEKAKANLITNINNFRCEFILSFQLTYQNAEQKDQTLIVNDKSSRLQVSNVEYSQTSDSVGFNIIFADQEVWNFYHPSTQEPSEDDKSEGIVFVEKVSSKGTFPFASEVTLSGEEKTNVGERYKNAYLQSFDEFEKYQEIKNSYNPDFVYNYATPYSNLRSDGDGVFQDIDGLYHHVWVRNSQNYLSDSEINLYVYSPNRGWWYLFYLLLVLVAGGLLVAITLIVKKKKASKKTV